MTLMRLRARITCTWKKLPILPQAPKRNQLNALRANHKLPFWEDREDQISMSATSSCVSWRALMGLPS
jgi:hypothetical protein